jgi:hypothetical protein
MEVLRLEYPAILAVTAHPRKHFKKHFFSKGIMDINIIGKCMCSKSNLRRLVPVLEGGDSLRIQHWHSPGEAKNMSTFCNSFHQTDQKLQLKATVHVFFK